jgi:hypothetical protein
MIEGFGDALSDWEIYFIQNLSFVIWSSLQNSFQASVRHEA